MSTSALHVNAAWQLAMLAALLAVLVGLEWRVEEGSLSVWEAWSI